MKFLLISVICLAFFACRSTNFEQWPVEIPDRNLFIAAYSEDSENQSRQSRRLYLQWVLSFYQGSLIYPSGWIDVQATVLANTLPPEREQLEQRLENLGGSIAAEWAKHNDLRVIDSRLLSLWESILQLAPEPEDRLRSIEVISEDIDDLLSGELRSADVHNARYEQKLGLELFSGF
ncbi:MAG: hypothetical protein O2971_07670 [Proteobacteria bacterium]|nr:hypothetical protein [Pseudomonadota bacterium]